MGAALSVPIDAVIRALRSYPNGVTTSDLARHLGLTPRNLAARLGKQLLYGAPIDRELGRIGHGGYEQSTWKVIRA